MIDDCLKCEDDARITEKEIKQLDMDRDRDVKKKEEKKKDDIQEMLKKLGLAFIAITILMNVLYSQPAASFVGCIGEQNIICYFDQNNPKINIIIYNPFLIQYNATLYYTGSAISIYRDNILLGYGSNISAQISLPYGAVALDVNVPIVGGSGIFNFTFSNNNDTYSRVYFVSYNRREVTTPTNVTDRQQNVSLIPVYSSVQYVVYAGNVYEFTLGLFNGGNVDIDIVDVSIEGIPTDVCYLDAQLGRLKPGEYRTFKLYINTTNLQTRQYLFTIKYVGKSGTTLASASTSVTLNVISREYQMVEQPSIREKSQLFVDYVIENNLLIVRGTYIMVNFTKSYVDANIYILDPKGSVVSYAYPIQLSPGERYCIYATYQNTIPAFTCVQVQTKNICVSIDPKPTYYENKPHYLVGTNVSINVYDCESLLPIYNYRLALNNEPYNKNTLYLDAEGTYILKILASGYSTKELEIVAYSPISVTSLPKAVGTNTIEVKGTYADRTKIDVYMYVNNTKQLIKSGYRSVVLDMSEGVYAIEVSPPLQDKLEFTISLIQPIKTEKKLDIFGYVQQYVWYIVIGFLVFTIIAVIIYKKSASKDLYTLAEKIVEEAKK